VAEVVDNHLAAVAEAAVDNHPAAVAEAAGSHPAAVAGSYLAVAVDLSLQLPLRCLAVVRKTPAWERRAQAGALQFVVKSARRPF
jgi:hypothetical protein